jgi:hypothetical protein
MSSFIKNDLGSQNAAGSIRNEEGNFFMDENVMFDLENTKKENIFMNEYNCNTDQLINTRKKRNTSKSSD